MLASRKVGKEGKVVAIWPSTEDYNAMVINLRENRCQNVIPVNMAVSERIQVLSFVFKGRMLETEADSLSRVL